MNFYFTVKTGRYLFKILPFTICIFFILIACGEGEAGLDAVASQYTYRIINEYPHDSNAFTQGLFFHNGYLYEGTGRYGASSIRRVDLQTGEVLQNHALDSRYFGEGITLFGDTLYQLTWTSRTGFIYDKESFDQLGTFNYPTQGWGLTNDNSRLIMSDGSATLYFLDPETLQNTGELLVTYNNAPVTRLNELEYINGEIYANVYMTDYIVTINPLSGQVTGWINLQGLLSSSEQPASMESVLNGIAYDSTGGRLFVTGKLWPKIFEIELVEIPG